MGNRTKTKDGKLIYLYVNQWIDYREVFFCFPHDGIYSRWDMDPAVAISFMKQIPLMTENEMITFMNDNFKLLLTARDEQKTFSMCMPLDEEDLKPEPGNPNIQQVLN